jgi:HEAT repeat protein
MAVRQPLLVRSMLIEDLRPHALSLCENVLPGLLQSPDPKQVLAALEILEAWQKAVPVELRSLLARDEPEIRAAALRVVARADEASAGVIRGLTDADECVQIAAAAAAGRLRLTAAIPNLTECLLVSKHDVARAAAEALAAMGDEGSAILRKCLHSPVEAEAGSALEALERVSVAMPLR